MKEKLSCFATHVDCITRKVIIACIVTKFIVNLMLMIMPILGLDVIDVQDGYIRNAKRPMATTGNNIKPIFAQTAVAQPLTNLLLQQHQLPQLSIQEPKWANPPPRTQVKSRREEGHPVVPATKALTRLPLFFLTTVLSNSLPIPPYLPFPLLDLTLFYSLNLSRVNPPLQLLSLMLTIM